MKKLINVKSNQFQNVLKKAIAEKPTVRGGGENGKFVAGSYRVRASGGDFYHVDFWRENGQSFGECECKAAEKNFYCYHFAAALMTHSAYVRLGVSAPAPSFSRSVLGVLPEIAEAMRVSV